MRQKEIQSNLNGSNIFRTMKICSRHVSSNPRGGGWRGGRAGELRGNFGTGVRASI